MSDPVKAWDAWYKASGWPEAMKRQRDAPRELDDEGISGKIVDDAFPFMAEGTVDGAHWNLRERQGWNLAIATTPEALAAIDGAYGRAPSGPDELTIDGDDGVSQDILNDDGLVPYSRAWEVVRFAVACWRRGERGRVSYAKTS